MATAVLDEWTEEKCLQLIREFRMRPILWDQKDPFYFKKNMKPKAWQEISDKINISPDKCKHKMIILMSSFRREKAKIMHSMADSSDTSQAYKSTWFAFKDMAFLMDKDNERKRQSQNCTDEDDDEDWAISNFQNKLLRNHVGIPIPMRNRKSLAYKQDVYQKVLDLVQDDDHPTHPTPGPSQTIEERDDEIKSFLSFIGNKMKRYTDETKNAVQRAICEVIFKADQNFYESNCTPKYTIIDNTESDPLHKELYEMQTEAVIKVQNESDEDEISN
ncbi:unnamed protein product [Spodoptera exigua]|uniref:MADF domain-containing protein n=1 Tax=Spodoptera exigua TaxID=7107 RepID=A0A922MGC7_SPOEX|nr:hypothetical protein HF086_008398 [Spodoptera exigua]CAH0674109.1 unnamed protein product [Spodoptera exigua]